MWRSLAQLANAIHEAAFRDRFDLAGTKSTLADRFLTFIREAGLPDPLPNAAVQTAKTRIEVDFRTVNGTRRSAPPSTKSSASQTPS